MASLSALWMVTPFVLILGSHPVPAVARHPDAATELVRHAYHNKRFDGSISSLLDDEGFSFRRTLQNATEEEGGDGPLARCLEESALFKYSNPVIETLFEGQEESILETAIMTNGDVVGISLVVLPYTLGKLGETCRDEGGLWAVTGSRELLCSVESVWPEELDPALANATVLADSVNVNFLGICYDADACNGLGRLDLLAASLDASAGWNCTPDPGVDQTLPLDGFGVDQTKPPDGFGVSSGSRWLSSSMGILAAACLAMIAAV
mmetsp:Transcript_35405/g.85411  ORF Transcript_35405/g.85411 Transcript_35405/m.85411 type:complete len:265 (-) Transcript_35405:189-983(-)